MQFIKSGSGVTSSTADFLRSDWRLASAEPHSIGNPSELEKKALDWVPAIVPGTVAQALQEAGKWDISHNGDFDARDWWYQCTFESDVSNRSGAKVLRFSGLATLAEAWLNGVNILTSDNMFLEYEIDVTRLLQSSNNLTICFRSLDRALNERRPRPRWKTRLVSHQQLRWIRTTLLGRIPGWTPPVAVVGPWRDIALDSCDPLFVKDISLRPYLEDGHGVVDFSCGIETAADQSINAVLHLSANSNGLHVEKRNTGYLISGQLRLKQPELWWPHTHGHPALYKCGIELNAGGRSVSIDCGEIGFRTVTVNQKDGAFDISVNGEKVFCRGACWTVNDIVSIHGSPRELERCLMLAQDAGMNMIRIGGTMVYESELFYSLCGKLGIMVWQDFMFANMDYPVEDGEFESSVKNEITQQLKRWQSHPCITVYCGNSEVEQQAAMLGVPQELWRSHLFSQLIPDLCAQWHPGVPYVPSTPSGGALPFHVGSGITHYYGVGAYMRPIAEVRRANVRFTPECLGFSNVPENETLNALFDVQVPVCHHPLWKSRVPRDSGSAWDFEDIRDYYLKELFHKDPVQLRCFDMEQYLALSRITTGEVMQKVFSEWRSVSNQCGGALVWFYKDLWPGAGWGIIDSSGTAKACFYYLKRVWQPQSVVLTDEGLDGIHAHIINETGRPLIGNLELMLIRDDNVIVAKATKDCEVTPRSKHTLLSDELLGGFYDVSYAYRFGPPKHDVAVATLRDVNGATISEAFHFPGQRNTSSRHKANLIAEAAETGNGDYLLSLQSDVFLQAVHFDITEYSPEENYFHLAPGRKKDVLFRRTAENAKKFKAYVEALNLDEPLKIAVKSYP